MNFILVGALVAVLSSGCGIAREVQQEASPQADLSSRIKFALIQADTGAASIRVDATQDAVTLGGFVVSEEERQQALTIARDEAGDIDVLDELTVRQ